MLRNFIYIVSSILIFFSGIVAYGVILNLREITLDEAKKISNIEHIINPSIIVYRGSYKLELYSDSTKIKTYNVVFGKNNSSIKLSKNDFITPIGEYKVCSFDTSNLYYKKIMLNYPNLSDASEALRIKKITREEFLMVSNSLEREVCSYKETILGGNIGIQGTGEYNIIFKNLPFVFNWTNGSIAMSNENIDELLSVIKIGTRVIIKN